MPIWLFGSRPVWIWIDVGCLPFNVSCLWLGQISASLAAMSRTVEDYDSMAKREMIKAKQEKAMMFVFTLPGTLEVHKLTEESNARNRRVQKFRSDYNELRSQFERLKAEVWRNPNMDDLTSLIHQTPRKPQLSVQNSWAHQLPLHLTRPVQAPPQIHDAGSPQRTPPCHPLPTVSHPNPPVSRNPLSRNPQTSWPRPGKNTR